MFNKMNKKEQKKLEKGLTVFAEKHNKFSLEAALVLVSELEKEKDFHDKVLFVQAGLLAFAKMLVIKEEEN